MPPPRQNSIAATIFKHLAFTLAEVLITLGILGIVSALTIPSFMQKYKKEEATARLKKFYSTMGQAITLSESKNGTLNDLLEKNAGVDEVEEWFNKYLAGYLKFEKGSYSPNKNRGFTVYLADGSSFYLWKANCTEVFFDINGDKKPNTMGRDQFNFMLCSDNIAGWADNKHWSSYYNSGTSRLRRRNLCITEPRFCSGLLEYDNWEFKEDYPYRL